MHDTRQDVIHFWFEETQPVQWFQKNPDFDDLVRSRFGATYDMARGGLCEDWKRDADGCLALCIVLDQFPRNMFRDTPKAFETDGAALLVSKHAISCGFDQVLPPLRRRFLYLPFEHSESLSDQNRSVELFGAMKKEDPLGYEYALRHREVIEKFGRFPHRNNILQRISAPEEIQYLAQPGSGF